LLIKSRLAGEDIQKGKIKVKDDRRTALGLAEEEKRSKERARLFSYSRMVS
jgi:hypothetical protein